MLAIPVSYSFRNLWVRRVTTILTALGMSLVVYVFSTVLMLDAGLRQTLVGTGESDHILITRQGSVSEVQSSIDRTQANVASQLPGIASLDAPLVSREALVLVNLTKRSTGSRSNLVVRGLEPIGVSLRRQVRITEGRAFRPGSNEIVVGSAAAQQFQGTDIGQSLRFGGRDWLLVGIFDGGGSGFDSEVWTDADVLMQTFRRTNFSSMVVRLREPSLAPAYIQALKDDPRLTLTGKVEQDFYAEQSESMSTFIRTLGLVLTGIFSIGAVIGATITMQSAVATRVGEIGTLRALGFQRSAILLAFLMESVLLALVGGVIGLLFASLMESFQFSTTNFQSFSELAFGFVLTPGIVVAALLFSVGMGVVGGMLPAIKAARATIVDALRAA